jgi:hypothetical protein
MQLNPAVLQCGPSLEDLGAGEIKSFAQVRSFGNTLVLPQLRPALVGIVLAAVGLAVASQAADAPPAELVAMVDVLRPLLGGVLGASFLFTAYAAARSS